MRRTFVVLALLCLALPSLTSCGDEPAADAGNPSDSEQIDITIEGDTVTPNGERVDVGAGEPIELVVKSDKAGDLHVHSSPEQELTFGAGTTTLKLTIDEPGVVDVELHEPEVVVLQLEVR